VTTLPAGHSSDWLKIHATTRPYQRLDLGQVFTMLYQYLSRRPIDYFQPADMAGYCGIDRDSGQEVMTYNFLLAHGSLPPYKFLIVRSKFCGRSRARQSSSRVAILYFRPMSPSTVLFTNGSGRWSRTTAPPLGFPEAMEYTFVVARRRRPRAILQIPMPLHIHWQSVLRLPVPPTAWA